MALAGRDQTPIRRTAANTTAAIAVFNIQIPQRLKLARPSASQV